MKRFLRKLISKIFALILIAAIVFAGYYYRGKIKSFALKMKGVYYIYKGDQAYSQDNMAATLNYYTSGLKLFPEHYEAWFNLGNIYAVYEDYYSAVDAYLHAIEHNPRFVMARMNLGIVYSEDLGFFDDAIEQFDEVTRIRLLKLWIPFVYSNVKSVQANRGLAYFNKGVAYKQKAMYLPLEKKYMAYQYLGDAIEAYTSSLKFLKKNFDIYFNRAVAHHLRGEYRDAGLDYCKAIKTEPMRYEAHYNLAVLHRHMKNYRESISELEKAALLVTESKEDTSLQSAYIFNLLNEVSRRFMTNDDYGIQRLTDEPSAGLSYTYVNGRIVADEQFDKAMLENFKNCAGFHIFNEDDF